MKREFLEAIDLGEGVRLTKAAIDAIMAENGKDIEAQKATITSLTSERDGLKSQLETAKGWEQKYNAEIPGLTAERDKLQNEINTRNARDKVSSETGIPANLLTGFNEEECKAQADALLKWSGGKAKYPDGNDGGENNPPSSGSAGDKFAEWVESALH